MNTGVGNKGGVKAIALIAGVFVGCCLLFALIFVTSAVGINNNAVRQEAGIKAQYEQNQNNYDNYFKKVKEAAQVTEMYAGDLQKIYAQVIQGRKGSDQEMMRWIKESNPTLDVSVYKQIQQIIEAGRNSFEADQKSLIDKTRNYEIALRSFPDSTVLSFLGFPKIDLNKYKIVTSDDTQKAFETKKSAPIQVR